MTTFEKTTVKYKDHVVCVGIQPWGSFFFHVEVLKFLHVQQLLCVSVLVPQAAMLDVSLPVVMHQHVDNFLKQVRLLWAKEASSDLVNGLLQLWQPVVVLICVVSKQNKITHTLSLKEYTHTQVLLCCHSNQSIHKALVAAHTGISASSQYHTFLC